VLLDHAVERGDLTLPLGNPKVFFWGGGVGFSFYLLFVRLVFLKIPPSARGTLSFPQAFGSRRLSFFFFGQPQSVSVLTPKSTRV
jgi:hypothetical protein